MDLDIIGKLMALSSALFWGIAVIFFKRSGETISPFALNLYKCFTTSVLLSFTLIIINIPLIPQDISLNTFLLLVISGIVGITIADSLFFKCLNSLGAGISAIIECSYAPMLIIMSAMVFSESIDRYEIIGGVMVISAVIIGTLKRENRSIPTKAILLGVTYGTASMFFLVIGVLLMKPAINSISPIWIALVRMIASFIALSFIILIRDKSIKRFKVIFDISSWKYAFPGTFFGSFLGMIFWIWAFKYTEMGSAGILNQMSTVFTIILASLFLKEPFTIRRIIAGLLAMFGSILIFNG